MTERKNETRNAIIWIVLYVVIMSVGENLNTSFGLAAGVTAPLALLFVAALCVYLCRIKGWEYYGFKGAKKLPAARLLFFLPLIGLATVNLWRGFTVNLTPVETALYIFFMLCVGFIEETLFRGFLFRAMLRGGVGAAVAVSSLTFGFGHIVNLLNGAELLPTLLQLVYASSIGLMLTLLVLKTGNILPGIIFHGMFNALSVFSREAGITDGYRTAVCAIITVVSLGYSAWLWFKLPSSAWKGGKEEESNR